MLVTPLVLIQIFSKKMLVDWPKCGSDPRDEGHLACLTTSLVYDHIDKSAHNFNFLWVEYGGPIHFR